MSYIKCFLIVLTIFANCFANPIFENPTFIKLEEELSKVKTAKGNMMQNINGEITYANFILSIPGKLKINYPKMKLTLVVNNGVLIYYDEKLDQKSQTINFNNPFLKSLNKLSLKDSHFNIIDFKDLGNEVAVIVKFKVETKEEMHRIIFTKNKDSFSISKIEDITPGSNIVVIFSNIVINEPISAKSFTIESKKIDRNFEF